MAIYWFIGAFKEWVAVRGRENVSYWCMPFMLCLLSFLFTSLFLFSLLFPFQFSLFPTLVAIPPSIYDHCSYLYCVNPIGFLSFTPMAHQPFYLLWAPLHSCPLTYWLLGLHYIEACPVPSLSSTTHSMTNPNSFGSAMSLSLLLEQIRLWVSLSTYLSSMHKVVPTVYHLFWAKMPS